MTTEEITDPDDLCDIAEQHHQAGRLADAEALYQNILQIDPGHPGALYFLGGIAYGDGRYEFAFELVNQLIFDEPNDAEALHLLGLIAAKLEKNPLAVELIQKALALQPAFLQAHYSLGDIWRAQGQLHEAAVSFQRALTLNPQFAEAHCSLGNVFGIQGKLAEAAASYRKAILIKSDLDLAHSNLGQVLQAQGKLDEAIVSYRNALSLSPHSVERRSNLAAALLKHGQLDEAIICLEQAILLNPDSASLYNNLGGALVTQGNLSKAEACYRRVLTLQPDNSGHLLNCASVLILQGQLQEAIDNIQHALTLEPNNVAAYSTYLLALHYLPNYSREKLFADHMQFGERFETPLKTNWPIHAKVGGIQRRLKVGFVSGDLYTHPVGFFLEGVLNNIDRQAIDITLYPYSTKSDALTERLRASELTWTPLTELSDADAAQRISADGIDILVDLSGHASNNRLLIFARKPAPVQVTWLGYWATTGLRAIDYILCDKPSVPVDEVDFYVEKPWYLPHTRLCFTPPTDNIAVGALPATSAGCITFGCFNKLIKITDPVVALWAEILHGVKNSRLFLKSRSLGNVEMQQSVFARFGAHGITADRLILGSHSARAEYFAEYHRVDIALDPFPFTGGTTSIEGLWMGVPLITMRGDRMIAHQGESILHNMGLQDWIATDDAAYVAQAIARAKDLTSLVELRGQLRSRLLASPLCDAPKFARDLEHAFKNMWKEYCMSS
ncbi:MAG TPA: tetratricopeptide repeat protein [Spongiibacteraceae bacterium]